MLLFWLMKYVSEEAAGHARRMEAALQKLPAEAGILFASVKPVPVEGGDARAFSICIGMSRRFEEGTGLAVAAHLFDAEVQAGRTLDVKVFRGVLGACRDSGAETARPPAS